MIRPELRSRMPSKHRMGHVEQCPSRLVADHRRSTAAPSILWNMASRVMPALLTRTVDRPEIGSRPGRRRRRRRRRSATVPFVDARCRVSALKALACIVIAGVVRRHSAAGLLQIAFEIAAPMPRVPPVTSATRAHGVSP